MMVMPAATLMPRAELEARQVNIGSIIGGGTETTTVDSGSGGSVSQSVTSTTSSSQSVTSDSTTSSSSSSVPTTSSTSTTSQQPVTTTSSARTVITSASTSNGVVIQTVITTEQPTVVTSTPTGTGSRQTGGSSSSNGAVIGGVVGGVVGGLALLTLIVLAIIIWRRRKARTGHGWLLCFGREPERKDELDVDWPTFDPAVGAAGVGGTFGADTMGRRRSGNAMGNVGTLPDVDDPYYAAGTTYGGHDEMSAYTGPTSYASPTSDGTHQRQQSQQWNMSSPPMSSAAEAPSVPDYSHLDAPEVREERARQQAQAHAHAQAMAAATAAAASHSHSYSGNNSPSPPAAEHRLSQGTTQMLSDNNFFMAPPYDESGTLQPNNNNRHSALHLHNPDA